MNNAELEVLVKAHQAQVFRYLVYLGADRSIADDITQETFLAVFAHSNPLQASDGNIAAWLRGIARNLFLRHCRRSKHSPVQFDSKMLDHAENIWVRDFLHGGDGFDYVEALRLCLGELPAKHRQIIESRYARCESREQMASLFAMSQNGIKSILRRIRLGLADCVRDKLNVEQV